MGDFFKSIDRYGEEAFNGGIWESATTDPSATGNTPPGPRWIENTTNGSKWFIDANGVAKSIERNLLHQFEKQTATANQTSFTLQKTPILGATGKVRVSRNGIDITEAFTWSGNVGTYDPAENYGCIIDANDNLQFEYESL